ncbi:MAG: PEGA domain-containing protein [bacterium]|nr:PEGA domain-containing protein [bacterium]
MSKTTERPCCRTRTLLLLLVAALFLMLMTASTVLAGSGGQSSRQETQTTTKSPSTSRPSPPSSPRASSPRSSPRVSQPSPPRASRPSSRPPSSGSNDRGSGGRDTQYRRPEDRTTYPGGSYNRPGRVPGGSGGSGHGRRPGCRGRDCGGHHGGGHYGGGYYWPYWPRYPWRHYYYRGFYHYPYYGYPYPYDYYYGRPVVRVDAGVAQGALDLDVRPDDTEVYLDGQLIGTTDDYDGWPRYLWLHEGTYELIFYNEGYQTVVREYAIRPDVVLDVDERMQPGESIPAEELTTAERSEDDEEYAFRRQERYDEPRWDRYEGMRQGTEPAPEELDARADPGRVHLKVEPVEASIYLDGRFVGTGDELGRLRSGLLIDAGEHLVQVVHPKFAPKEKTFSVEAGEQLELTLSLEL